MKLLRYLEIELQEQPEVIREKARLKESQLKDEIADFISEKTLEYNSYISQLVSDSKPLKTKTKNKHVNFDPEMPKVSEPSVYSSSVPIARSQPISIGTNSDYLESDGGHAPALKKTFLKETEEDKLVSNSLLRSKLDGETDPQHMSFSERMEFEKLMKSKLHH